MPDILVRHETPADLPAVRVVNEAALVDALRENGKITLSLVAAIEGEVVGHILFSDIDMEPGGTAARILGLAPMAVRPDRQGRGIGSALVRRGIEDCRELGYRGVVVLGHPEFYPRFGFTPASRHGITCIYDAPDEAFMALALGDAALPKGRALYQPEFAAV